MVIFWLWFQFLFRIYFLFFVVVVVVRALFLFQAIGALFSTLQMSKEHAIIIVSMSVNEFVSGISFRFRTMKIKSRLKQMNWRKQTNNQTNETSAEKNKNVYTITQFQCFYMLK